MSDNPARAPFHLSGPGIMTYDKQFSIHVSRTLDCIGKSQDMVKYRVKMYRERQGQINIINPYINHITTGSKIEGLTSLYESDLDRMYVLHDVICADDVRPYKRNRNNTVFQTERHETHVGYSKLKLVQEGHAYSQTTELVFNSVFQKANGKIYISSDLFITNLQTYSLSTTERDEFNYHARSGPSLPMSTLPMSSHAGEMHADTVHALCCVCPDILRAFITRPRPYNRPSRNVLNRISHMDSHVVPVGCKESNTLYQEWRICFTEAEIHLVHNFNEIETKLYILLKMIAKLLKYISNDITSYVMKNVALWMVELYPAAMFTEELLTSQLLKALVFLRKCVNANYLPSYMISDRNLLAGRLEPVQRRKLTSFLSTLIHEEGSLLLRCEKLQVAMTILYREPALAEEFRCRRDMMEKMYLLLTNGFVDKMVKSGRITTVEQVLQLPYADNNYNITVSALFLVIVPELLVLLLQGYSAEDIAALFFERSKLMLS